MTIRKYKATDRSDLIAIIEQNVPKYFAKQEIEDFRMYLDSSLEDYFVVLVGGGLIAGGGINYRDDGPSTARLSWDFVTPEMHGKGIGSELVKHRIDFIKANSGVTELYVRTSQLTHKFYEKFGFKVIAVEKDYWAEGFDLYNMRLPLTAK